MEPAPSPVGYADIADARTCYGWSTSAWSASGRLQVEDDWWVALSGTLHVDYNLALLHGPTSPGVTPGLIQEVTAARVPSLIMLAGAGLAAAEALRDAGWVCTGALPFMARIGGPAVDDPDVRQLVSALDVEGPEAREDCRLFGLFEDGVLRSCSFTQWVEGRYSVGWALSTAPDQQRSGYGRRLLRASTHHRIHGGGPPVALLMATPVAERLYREERYVTLEYWQIWSRARWVLP